MVFYISFIDIDRVSVLLPFQQELTVAVVDQNFVGTPTSLAKQRLKGFRSVQVRQ